MRRMKMNNFITRKYLFLATIMGCSQVFSASLAQERNRDFLMDLDIPLMSGLVENTDEAMVFDSPEGRIINAEAQGQITAIKTFEYYRSVLPSLGWNINKDQQNGMACEEPAQYCIEAIRDQESLLLQFSANNGTSKISYSLFPNS